MFFRGTLSLILLYQLLSQVLGCHSGPIPRWSVKRPFQGLSIQVHPTELPSELVLQLEYELDPNRPCEEGLIARIEYQKRAIRANLHPEISQTQILLGKSPNQAESLQVRYFGTDQCGLKKIKAHVYSASQHILSERLPLEEQLALQHSPFIAVRSNQVAHPFTDVPLDLAYSFIHHPEKNTDTLRYTAYFSDEDSIGSTSGTDAQMVKYGRRTDIEWVYEVELDAQHHVTRKRYQGGYLFGIGHRTVEFEGEFLAGSDHPILYDIADHNVFSDSPSDGHAPVLEGYHFVPKTQIRSPEAREWVMFRNPWMFQVSDRELIREKKLSRPSTDYLYVLVDGELPSGSLEGQISFIGQGRALATAQSSEIPNEVQNSSNLDRLGEDLWNRQSFTAIPVGAENLAQIFQKAKHGVFNLLKKPSTPFKYKTLQFFRLKKSEKIYQMEELTRFFQCKDSQDKLTCLF